ncbi:porin [Paracoccus chinensis]|uniref:Outer membrane protein OmpU n=1 Tax=Paracoccus chinensis TaxID=525640 RepID=A0A1G9KBY9_9RHOB|nr:porin [Paracoccus chinensis]SDL46783.1 outer membrane protein OmpU [Paracoccus chinensis]
MKKLLIATSALVALTGAASAEVALTGDGRMGLVWDGENAQFSSRVRAKFNLSGETDSGLSFGGSFRVDQENYSAAPESRSAAHGTAGSVYVSGTFGKLSMGDVVSAAEAAIGDLTELGYTSGEFASNPEEIDFLTGDGENEEQGPTALYEYTFNGVNLFASMTDGSRRDCSASNVIVGDLECFDFDEDDSTDVAFSLAAGYEFGAYNVALAYSENGDGREIVLGGTAAINEFKIKAFYADYKDRDIAQLGDFEYNFDDDETTFEVDYDRAYGLSVEYAMANGVGIQGLWIRREVEILEGFADLAEDTYDAYGIGASYDLGAGATLAGAIIKNEVFEDNETRADVGIKFQF